MKYTYLPPGGGLTEALQKCITSHNLIRLLERIVALHHNAFKLSDLALSYYCFDSRFNSSCYLLTTSAYYVKYTSPHAIGYIYPKNLKLNGDKTLC